VVFQGATALSLDPKGRLAIPARYRDTLVSDSSGQLVLTVHPHRCLLLYPALAWEPIRTKVLAASSFDDRSAAYQRMLVGYACDESLDSAGRLLIPLRLRERAQFEKQVWLIGQGSHFEIWSDAGWQEQEEKFLGLCDQPLPPGLEDLAL
jgi:MraZ protein